MSRPEQAEGSQPQAVAGSVGVVRSRAVECARDCSAATATVADRPCSWHGQWRAGSVGAFGPGDGSCDDADARSAWCRCPATFPAGGWQHWWPGFAVDLSGRGEYAADRKSNTCEVVQQHSTGPAAVANTKYRERTARTETPALFAEITALNVSSTPRKAMTCAGVWFTAGCQGLPARRSFSEPPNTHAQVRFAWPGSACLKFVRSARTSLSRASRRSHLTR
jgi:hypothetical protein